MQQPEETVRECRAEYLYAVLEDVAVRVPNGPRMCIFYDLTSTAPLRFLEKHAGTTAFCFAPSAAAKAKYETRNAARMDAIRMQKRAGAVRYSVLASDERQPWVVGAGALRSRFTDEFHGAELVCADTDFAAHPGLSDEQWAWRVQFAADALVDAGFLLVPCVAQDRADVIRRVTRGPFALFKPELRQPTPIVPMMPAALLFERKAREAAEQC